MSKRIKWLLDNLWESETLTEWEGDFLVSVSQQHEDKGTLSEKQVDILEKIYREDNVRK